jgi:hypothetical protein
MSAILKRAIKSQLKLITVTELSGYRLGQANETVTDTRIPRSIGADAPAIRRFPLQLPESATIEN